MAELLVIEPPAVILVQPLIDIIDLPLKIVGVVKRHLPWMPNGDREHGRREGGGKK